MNTLRVNFGDHNQISEVDRANIRIGMSEELLDLPLSQPPSNDLDKSMH